MMSARDLQAVREEQKKCVEIQRRLGEEYQAAMDGQNRMQAM